jgi:hypothetical protein
VGRFEEDEDGHKVVISDTEEQQRRETTAAEEVFIERRDVGTVTAELGEEVGQPAPEPVGAVPVEQPAGNASREAWAEFAIASGAPAAEVEGKTRDELRDHYGNRGQA